MRGYTFLIAALLCSVCAQAQGPRPVRPRFWTKTEVLTVGLGVSMMVADVVTTHEALKVPGTHEANPLARSTASLYALKVAGVGVGLGVSYTLYKSGHYRAARAVPVILGAPSGLAAIHNSQIH